MGLSKRAKRGISIFNHIQTETQRVKYMFHPQRMMIDLNAVPEPIVQAGLDAIKVMRENANAIQKLSESQNNADSSNPEGGAQSSVPVQPENGEDRPKNTETGAESGGGNQ